MILLLGYKESSLESFFFFFFFVSSPSPLFLNRVDGLVVKASASRAEDPGFESRFRRDFSGSSYTSDSKIGTPVALGVVGSVLGLVGPVSVYCDWSR